MKPSFFKYGLLFVFLIIFPACASQTGFSKSFPSRLTDSQNFWHFHSPVNLNPAPGRHVNTQNLWMDADSIQQMLNGLVYVSPLRGYPVQAVIVNDPKVNAYTNGLIIYVNSGLLILFRNNEDLIASIMAHELGHILANHQPEGNPNTSSLSYLNYLTPALRVLPYGGLYSGLAGTAVQEGVHIREYSYSRLQENEADVIGAYLASEAGYNAVGLSDFLDYTKSSGFGAPQNLSIPTSVSAIPESVAVMLLSSSPLYRTHPPSAKRKEIVTLVVQREKGIITQKQLRKKARWLANLYETLERRKPKNSSNVA